MRHQCIRRSPKDATEFQLGYCLGLITGEGTFNRSGRQLRITVKLAAVDRAPLLTLFQVMGGLLYGPYTNQGRHAFIWTLGGRGLAPWIPVITKRFPPSRKREQWLEAIAWYSRADRPEWKRSPANVSRKTIANKQDAQATNNEAQYNLPMEL